MSIATKTKEQVVLNAEKYTPSRQVSVVGSQVLDDVSDWLTDFVAYPHEDAVTAHVLWIAHCWLAKVLENTPRLAFLSPEPGSGKTRALEVTEPLLPVAVITVNPSLIPI